MKAIIGIVLLGAAYGFGSLAIDTGRWLFYFLCFVSLFAAANLLTKLLRHGKDQH